MRPRNGRRSPAHARCARVGRRPWMPGGSSLNSPDCAETVCHGADRDGKITRQMPEDILLAGEILVERRPGAAGDLGDQFHAGVVETTGTEHLERGSEDGSLGDGAAFADQRAVAERRASSDLHCRNPIGADFSLL